MIKFFKYFLQAIIIYFFLIISRLIGLTLSRFLFSNIFLIFGKYFRSQKITYRNLNLFNKNLSDREKKTIVTQMWRNFGMTFVEYVFLNHFKKNKSHLEIVGEENLEKIIKTNEPVIFVSGHFANFELMSMEIVRKKIKLATIYRPLNNFFLNPLMEYLRKKYVCKNQIKKGIVGVKDTVNFIKNNYSIALMIDQRVSEGEKINLFDNYALTTTLPAQLAMKYKLKIIPVFIERKNNKDFIINFYSEISPSNFKNRIELSQELNSILEKMILKNPGQWIWTHNRWK